MNQSPGHHKWPDHKVQESPIDKRVTVEINGQRIADSSHTRRGNSDHGRGLLPLGAPKSTLASHTT